MLLIRGHAWICDQNTIGQPAGDAAFSPENDYLLNSTGQHWDKVGKDQ